MSALTAANCRALDPSSSIQQRLPILERLVARVQAQALLATSAEDQSMEPAQTSDSQVGSCWLPQNALHRLGKHSMQVQAHTACTHGLAALESCRVHVIESCVCQHEAIFTGEAVTCSSGRRSRACTETPEPYAAGSCAAGLQSDNLLPAYSNPIFAVVSMFSDEWHMCRPWRA